MKQEMAFRQMLKDRVEGLLSLLLMEAQYDDVVAHFPSSPRPQCVHFDIPTLRDMIWFDLKMNPSDEDIGAVVQELINEGKVQVEFHFTPKD